MVTRSETQKRYLMRLAARTQAASMHLSEIETLASFEREDGLIITVAADGTWHNLDSADTASIGPGPVTPHTYMLPTGVTPELVREETVHQAIAMLDKNGASFRNIRDRFAREVSVMLATLNALDSTAGGPDWREEIGLETAS